MCIFKIYFFYLPYWLRLLLIVRGDVESTAGPGYDKRFRVLFVCSRIHNFYVYEFDSNPGHDG